MTATRIFTAASVLFALGLFVAYPRAAAQETAPDGAVLEESQAQEEDPLHESMMTLQRSMRAMRTLMRKPEMTGEALAACASMEGAVRVALEHPPEIGADGKLEGSALLAHQIAFKRKMLSTYTALLDLQAALDSGDGDAAKAAYRALGAQKKEGHDSFMFDDQ